MSEPYTLRRSSHGTIQNLGNFVLVIACLYWAQRILMPIALAVLLTFILSSFVSRLQRLGLGRIPAVFLVAVVSFALLGCICWVIAAQLRSLLDEIPQHRSEIAAKLKQLQQAGPTPVSNFVDMVNDIVKKIVVEPPRLSEEKEPQPVVVVHDRLPTLSWVASAFSATVELILIILFMAVLTVFMLAQREDLRHRFFQACGEGQLAVMSRAFDVAAQRISSYLRAQLLLNLAYGLTWSLCLFLLPNGEGARGVPYALFWGVLLAALRFIPYIGSWVALSFPLLLSIALSPINHAWLQPLLLISVFLVLELIVANVVEPLLFGRNAGVSPLALLIAAVFWAWLWGPIGLVLSTPLTVCLIVLGKYVPALNLLHVFFGPDPRPEIETRYYQRLLVHDEDEATEIVQARLKERPPESVYDELVLPALTLAHRDTERGSLEPNDEQFILEATRHVVEEVVGPELKTNKIAPGDNGNTAATDEPTRVLACPARGEADELALKMLDQLLRAENFQIETVSSQVLSSEIVEKVREEQPVLACISALPPGGLAQASYLCKRLRVRFPDLKIIVGRWGQSEDVDKMKDRLYASGATKVVASLLEMRQEILPLRRLKKPQANATIENVSV